MQIRANEQGKRINGKLIGSEIRKLRSLSINLHAAPAAPEGGGKWVWRKLRMGDGKANRALFICYWRNVRVNRDFNG